MTPLALPVLLASLAGGLHCVAMCGPFSAAAGGFEAGRAGSLSRQVAYHAGRLAAYAALGALAGGVGGLLDLGGALAGVARISAIVAGASLVVFGVSALWPRRDLIELGRGPKASARWLARLLAWGASRAPLERAFVLGLATAFVPCGWLYAFVMTAAGTGAIVPALTVMLAFWAGTVPWLLGASFGIRALVPRLGARVRTASACLVAIAGLAILVLRVGAPLPPAPSAPPEAPATAAPAPCPLHSR